MLQRINRLNSGDARCGQRRGFTLIELMAVMAIVMVLSGLVVAGYFGIVRGSARASASQHLFNNLMLTRQRAMMNGAQTFLMVLPPEEGATTLTRYAIVQSAGRITGTTENRYLLDRYADLQNLFAGDPTLSDPTQQPERLRFIYNITGLSEDQVAAREPFELIRVLPPDPNRGQPRLRESYYLELRIPQQVQHWNTHDRYGWQVGTVQYLPRGYRFDQRRVVAFEPTGNISGNQTVKFLLIEEINPDRPIEIEVSRVGSIRVVRE